MALVMKQPDLGTSLTYMPILVAGVLMAGLRWKQILISVAGAGCHFTDRLQFA